MSEATPERRPVTQSWWFWALIAAAVGLGAALSWLSWFGIALETRPKDRERLVTIDDLVPHLAQGFDRTRGDESFERTVYLDGTVIVDYEYEQLSGGDYVYIATTIDYQSSLQNARIAYLAYERGVALGAVFSDEALTEAVRNDLFEFGDQSRFGIVQSDGEPIGNHFVARKGRRIFSMLLFGLYFDDAEPFAELMTPRLTRFAEGGR